MAVLIKPTPVAKLTQTANEKILDRAIGHAIYLEQLKKTEAQKVVALLNNDVIPDVVKTLESRLAKIAARGYDTSVATTSALRRMLKATNGVLQTGIKAVGGEMAK